MSLSLSEEQLRYYEWPYLDSRVITHQLQVSKLLDRQFPIQFSLMKRCQLDGINLESLQKLRLRYMQKSRYVGNSLDQQEQGGQLPLPPRLWNTPPLCRHLQNELFFEALAFSFPALLLQVAERPKV